MEPHLEAVIKVSVLMMGAKMLIAIEDGGCNKWRGNLEYLCICSRTSTEEHSTRIQAVEADQESPESRPRDHEMKNRMKHHGSVPGKGQRERPGS